MAKTKTDDKPTAMDRLRDAEAARRQAERDAQRPVDPEE